MSAQARPASMSAEVIGNPSSRTRRGWRGLMAAIALCLLNDGPVAQPTVLTFEDLPAGTIVTTQYGARGVVFQGAFVGTDFGARSGTRALRSVPPTAEIFNPVQFVMSFTSPQSRVKLFVNSPSIPRGGSLSALDANDFVVAQDGPRQVAADAFTSVFEVTTDTPSIVRAVLLLDNAVAYAIDDLEFEGSAAKPPPPAPQVIITSPPNGAEFDTERSRSRGR